MSAFWQMARIGAFALIAVYALGHLFVAGSTGEAAWYGLGVAIAALNLRFEWRDLNATNRSRAA